MPGGSRIVHVRIGWRSPAAVSFPVSVPSPCPAFVPEDKRGYKKKTAPAAEGEPAPAEETKEAEPVKKTTRKSKKDADTGEKPAKKSAAKKTAAKKS